MNTDLTKARQQRLSNLAKHGHYNHATQGKFWLPFCCPLCLFSARFCCSKKLWALWSCSSRDKTVCRNKSVQNNLALIYTSSNVKWLRNVEIYWFNIELKQIGKLSLVLLVFVQSLKWLRSIEINRFHIEFKQIGKLNLIIEYMNDNFSVTEVVKNVETYLFHIEAKLNLKDGSKRIVFPENRFNKIKVVNQLKSIFCQCIFRGSQIQLWSLPFSFILGHSHIICPSFHDFSLTRRSLVQISLLSICLCSTPNHLYFNQLLSAFVLSVLIFHCHQMDTTEFPSRQLFKQNWYFGHLPCYPN